MKKILLFSIALIYSLSVKAQKVQLNEGVSIKLPANAQSITKEQALAHAFKKFNNDKLVLDSYTQINPKYVYLIDEIALFLFVTDKTHKYESDRAIKSKESLDETNSSNKTYTSYIEKGDHNSAVVINYKAGKAEYYHFYCFNNNCTRVMTGKLEFDSADKSEATTILNDLLASIKFKD